ncbi:hypothetical protein AAH079_25575 [Bacteroides thetaiotaomicron]|uniref:hypothetical protein n=1 Tax=Bacteroides thetaiotaomicron TaxID=818 RepID=UPI0039B432AC
MWRGHPTHRFLRVRAELSYFPDRSRSRLHILYRCDDEYRLECRRLNRGSFLLKKEERKKDFLQISWNRLNELLTVKKYRKTVEK